MDDTNAHATPNSGTKTAHGGVTPATNAPPKAHAPGASIDAYASQKEAIQNEVHSLLNGENTHSAVPSSQEESPVHAKHVFDVARAERDHVDGVIVKDTRRKKWTLLGALKESLGSWFGEKQEALTHIARPSSLEPDVAPAATRAEIIKKAGAQSHIAPQDDHKLIVEKLRTYERDVARATHKPFTLKKADDTATPSWTHTKGNADKEKSHEGAPPTSIKEARPTITSDALPKKEAPLKKTVAHHVDALKKTVVPPQEKEHAEPKKHIAYGYSDVAPEVPQRHISPQQEVPQPRDERSARPAVGYGFSDVSPTVTPRTRASDTETPVVPTADTVRKAADTHASIPQEPQVQVPQPTFTPETRTISVTRETPQNTETKNLRARVESLAPREKRAVTARTYRDDAIIDVERNRRSVPEIASARIKEARPAERPQRQSIARPLLITFGILIVVTGVAAGALWWFGNNEEPDPATRIPSFIRGVPQIPVDFSTSREELMRLLTEAYNDAAGPEGSLVQLYPALPRGEGMTEAVSTAAFMDVFDPRANGSFIRSLENEWMFGAYLGSTRAPFFILETKQFDVALAGMIGWEEHMSADLAPLFGEPVPPNAAVSDVMFVDSVIRNTNVRILYDTLGESRIMYAFLDTDIIVITTDEVALITLIEAFR